MAAACLEACESDLTSSCREVKAQGEVATVALTVVWAVLAGTCCVEEYAAILTYDMEAQSPSSQADMQQAIHVLACRS